MSDTERENLINQHQAQNREHRRKRSDKIGAKLRSMYDDVASEPIPDEFLKLLEDADRSEAE